MYVPVVIDPRCLSPEGSSCEVQFKRNLLSLLYLLRINGIIITSSSLGKDLNDQFKRLGPPFQGIYSALRKHQLARDAENIADLFASLPSSIQEKLILIWAEGDSIGDLRIKRQSSLDYFLGSLMYAELIKAAAPRIMKSLPEMEEFFAPILMFSTSFNAYDKHIGISAVNPRITGNFDDFKGGIEKICEWIMDYSLILVQREESTVTFYIHTDHYRDRKLRSDLIDPLDDKFPRIGFELRESKFTSSKDRYFAGTMGSLNAYSKISHGFDFLLNQSNLRPDSTHIVSDPVSLR
jgi:hypothetical protein